MNTPTAYEAWNEGGASQHVGHRADVEAGQARVAVRVIEHGHSSSLHDAVQDQVNGLKRAEIEVREMHMSYMISCMISYMISCMTLYHV